jgi:hypothetical protein
MRSSQKTVLHFSSMLIIAIVILIFPAGNEKPVNGYNLNSYPGPGQGQGDTENLNYRIHLPIITTSPTPPQYSVSRYIYSSSSTYLHDTAGCAEGRSNNPYAFVFLDFGDPWIDASSDPITYGATLPNTTTHLTISQVEQSVQYYISGYYSCASAGAFIRVAVGVTNYGNSQNPNIDEHGKQWAEMLIRLKNWVEVYPSYSDKVSVFGAIDIEPSWGVPNDAIGWEQGYDSITGRRAFYNFGTCDSCPYKFGNQDHTDWQLPNGWDLDQIWYASFGPGSAHVFPEIYTREDAPETPINYFPAHEAYQWQYLKHWSATCTNCLPSYPPYNQWRTIFFTGVLTQYDACHDPGNPGAEDCRSIYADNTPAQGWLSFYNALATDNITKQDLDFSSDLTWKH